MLTEREKRLLTIYFEAIEAYEYYEKRDKAMFLLMLKFNLCPEEIILLRVRDFAEGFLSAGERTLELQLLEIQTLREYLRERLRGTEEAGEETLFTDSRKGVLTEGKIEDAVRYYVELLEGRR